MKDKAFLNLSILFFIIFFAGIAIITLDKPTSQLLRAANVEPSPLKSFAVVFPQTGKITEIQNPDSGTKIKAVITIRDVQGNALSNRTVKLSSNLAGTLINPSDTQTTSDIGQATYFISSTIPGKAELQAIDIDSNTTLVNIPTIEFTP